MADTSYTQNQVSFKLLNLFITNAVIMSSKIAYPEENTMEKTLVVTVCSVYFGDTIITSRLVREDDFAGGCHGGYFTLSNYVWLKLLNLVFTDAVITSSKIAYRGQTTMEETLVVTVCSAYFGNIINSSHLV